MLDIKDIRSNPENLTDSMQKRGKQVDVPSLLKLDEEVRNAVSATQKLQSERNNIAKQFGQAKAKGDDTSELSKQAEQIKADLAEHEQVAQTKSEELHKILSGTPNILADDVPVGTEDDIVEVRRFGQPTELNFEALEHYELGEKLGLMDFERATKMSGSRFVVLYQELARLERALAQFMLDLHTREYGYTEVYVPLLVHDHAMFGTGQLPKFRDDQFATNAGSWLIPTAEVAMTNLVREEILTEEELPLRFTTYTPCFRLEAGAAGRDTRGMIRQHQFGKVELVSITAMEESKQEHERMTNVAETVLKKLGLSYRVINLCSEDVGFSANKTYDLEVWMPGQKMYREISSCSNCGPFQARRMNARYRAIGEKKPQFVHTLNGSGVAVGRALIAIMENYQQADGSIAIPDVLQSYMGEIKSINIRDQATE